MPRRRRRPAKSSGTTLHRLPQEILSMVCDLLACSDLKSLRLVNKSVNDPGERSLFRTIYLRLNLGSFHKLWHIAHHPIFSKYVRMVCYNPKTIDNFNWATRDEWLRNHVGRGFDTGDKPIRMQDTEGTKIFQSWREWALASFSETELNSMYIKYTEHLSGQRFLLNHENEFTFLHDCFQKLPGLSELQFDIVDPPIMRSCEIWEATSVGQAILVEPQGLYHMDYVRHLWAMLRAVQDSGNIQRLQELRCSNVDLVLFDNTGTHNRHLHPSLAHLRSLSLKFRHAFWEGTPLDDVAAFLESATMLESLQLSFDDTIHYFYSDYIPLTWIIPKEQHWQNLHTLSLAMIKTTDVELRHLLETHKKTLRVLELRCIWFRPTPLIGLGGVRITQHGSWVNFFIFLNKSLSLTQAKFIGTLSNGLDEVWRIVRFDPRGLHHKTYTNYMCSKVERFVTRDGPLPFFKDIDDPSNEMSIPPWTCDEDESWWLDCSY